MTRNILPVIFVGFVGLVCLTSTISETPKTCRCEKFGTITNCTSLDLTQFNAHTVGCAQAFKIVDLTKNKLQEFPEDVGKYRIVNLSSNAILQVEAAQVQKTEILDVSRNLINKINLGETFPALVSLNLSENGLGIPFKDFLSGRCGLVHLDLGGNTIESLETITSCTRLSFLIAARNIISQLPSQLPALKNLEYLDLSNNRLKSVSNFPQTLKVLYLNGNALSTLRATFFAKLASLKHLDLEDNRINTIAPKTFEDLSSLELLYLTGNKLTKLSIESFQGLKALKVLQLTNNDISSVAGNTFSELPELKEVILDENLLTTLPSLLLGTKVLRVSLLLNLIQVMDPEALSTIFSGLVAPRIVVLALNPFRGDDPAWKDIVKEFKWRCADELVPLVEKYLRPNVSQTRYHSCQIASTDCPCAFFTNRLQNFGVCINDVPRVDGKHWLRVFEGSALPVRDEL